MTHVWLQEKVLWLCPMELKQPLCPSKAGVAPRAVVSSKTVSRKVLNSTHKKPTQTKTRKKKKNKLKKLKLYKCICCMKSLPLGQAFSHAATWAGEGSSRILESQADAGWAVLIGQPSPRAVGLFCL